MDQQPIPASFRGPYTRRLENQAFVGLWHLHASQLGRVLRPMMTAALVLLALDSLVGFVAGRPSLNLMGNSQVVYYVALGGGAAYMTLTWSWCLLQVHRRVVTWNQVKLTWHARFMDSIALAAPGRSTRPPRS